MKRCQIKCPYCRAKAFLRPASFIGHFGEAYKGKEYYVCANYPRCDSYVSAHRGSRLPMGTLADGQLRGLRREAHQAFNRLWKNRYMTIDEAYRWLQLKLGIPKSEAHIANFSEYRCKEVIRLCTEFISSVQPAERKTDRRETHPK